MALRGKSYTDHNYTGTIYAMSSYVRERVKPQGGKLELFHHARALWGTPDQYTPISTRKSGGVFGKGFYTSTKPETGYGTYEFDLTLPTKALANHKVLEVPYSTVPADFVMPAGVDVMALKPYGGDTTWFIFKPGSEFWVNGASTESDFDQPGTPNGP